MKKVHWKFWNKPAQPQAPQPRVFTVPPEHTERILQLIDAYRERPREACAFARYQLWKAIEDLFPETTTGAWKYGLKYSKTVTITGTPEA